MKIRKITSLTALISFIFLVLTSVVLYIVPQGRVAYWSDWHLWGLTKTEKDSAAKKYGEPPYGHAELSTLKTFTSKMSFDLAQSMERLKKADIKFESEKQTLQ